MNIFTLLYVRISVIYHYDPTIFGPMRYRLVQSKFSGRDRGGSEGIWKVLSLIENEWPQKYSWSWPWRLNLQKMSSNNADGVALSRV